MGLSFEWNSEKNRANLARHGVSFDEAESVFSDPLARIHDDPDHSLREQREIIVGESARGRLLLVAFTERGDGVRIISAREPDNDERRDYEEEASR